MSSSFCTTRVMSTATGRITYEWSTGPRRDAMPPAEDVPCDWCAVCAHPRLTRTLIIMYATPATWQSVSTKVYCKFEVTSYEMKNATTQALCCSGTRSKQGSAT